MTDFVEVGSSVELCDAGMMRYAPIMGWISELVSHKPLGWILEISEFPSKSSTGRPIPFPDFCFWALPRTLQEGAMIDFGCLVQAPILPAHLLIMSLCFRNLPTVAMPESHCIKIGSPPIKDSKCFIHFIPDFHVLVGPM